MERSGSTLPEALSAKPKHLNSVARQCGAVSSLGTGAPPWLRKEGLNSEELWSECRISLFETLSPKYSFAQLLNTVGQGGDGLSCLTDEDAGSGR